MTDRRTFLESLASCMLAPAWMDRATRKRTSMYLAYTSFAVRMLQGRDILKSTAAALDAEAFLGLCERFGVSGAQIDYSELPVDDAPALARLRTSFQSHGMDIELSIPSGLLESADAYGKAVAVARALGATRARV